MFRVAITFFFIVLLGQQASLAQTIGDYQSATSGDWNLNSTWQIFTPGGWAAAPASPNSFDGVVTVQVGHTVNFNVTEQVDQVIINGTVVLDQPGAEMQFPAVPTGDVLQINGTFDIGGNVAMAGNTIIRVNGQLIARQGGTLTGATAANLFLQSGSTFEHNYTSTAGTIPLATWDAASTLLISGNGTSTAPANLNQSFGSVTLDLPGGGGTLSLGGALTTVRGNFSTAPTNGRNILMVPGLPYTLNIDGDFVQGGTGFLNFTTTATNNSTILIGGDFTWTGTGAIIKAGTGTGTMNFDGATTQIFDNFNNATFGAISFIVSSGTTLDLGLTSVTGAGSLTVSSGATLRVGSTNSPPNSPAGALVNSTTLGNVRVSGSRTYASGSTIEYGNATNSPQYLGNGHPNGAGITTIINNSGGVTLALNLALNGDLILTSGDLDISDRSVTFGGTFTPNGNALVANVNTSVTINDAGTTADFGLLKFSGTSIIGNLTMGGATGRTVRLGADLAVIGDVNLNNGDLQLNGFTLNLQGGISQASGTLTSSATSSLNVSNEGLGTLPADLLIGGGSIHTLTMNRLGAELVTSSNLNIDLLNLVAGTFHPTGTVQMTSGGTISVASGVLFSPIGAVTNYNVIYNGTDDVFTAFELPTTGTTLNDLTITNPAAVTLSAPVTINGDLTLSGVTGIFNSDGNLITLRGDFVSDAGSDFFNGATVGEIIFDGTTTLSGSIAPLFGNVTVNGTHSLTISGDLEMDIAGDFAMEGTFDPGQSRVVMTETLSQTISRTTDSTPISFYQLEINKTSGGVTLTTPADIQDILAIPSVTTFTTGTNLLRLLSNATRTARVNPLPVGASIDGSVIVQRFLPNGSGRRAYRYLTPTVTGTNVQDWKDEVYITGTFDDPSVGGGLDSGTPSLYYYDESFVGDNTSLEQRYRNYPASGLAVNSPLTNGVGYALFSRTPGTVTIDTKGTLGQQQQVINVTNQDGGLFDGWNLIGNPYPSPVAWDKVTLSAQVGAAISIRDNTGVIPLGAPHFVTYVGGVSSPPNSFNGAIASGQAFWVHATDAGTVTFDETDKVISSDSVGQFLRTTSPNELVRLTLTSGDSWDETVVRFLDKATDSFDNKYDAGRFPSTELSLSSKLADGKSMVINTMGSLDCDKVIPLSINNLLEGNYTFGVSGLESFGTDVNVMLVDLQTGISTDLRTAVNFGFTVTAGNKNSFAGRYALEIGRSRLLKDLAVSKRGICFDETASSVTIHVTQPELEYKAMLKGVSFSEWTKGNGSDLNFAVSADKLATGTNSFTVLMKNSCRIDSLAGSPIIAKSVQPVITKTTNALACQTGEATLKAFGAAPGQSYYWFKTIDAVNAFEVSTDGQLALHNLTEDAAFYVAIQDTAGCTSERVKVEAKVVNYENVVIVQHGDTLISNYDSGVTWLFNGVPVTGAVSKQLELTANGLYTAEVKINGCVSRDSISIELPEGETDFTIYPNPTTDKIVLHLNNYRPASTVCVEITSTMGTAVFNDCVTTSRHSTLTIPAQSFAEGMYIVKVTSEKETLIKRVVKE